MVRVLLLTMGWLAVLLGLIGLVLPLLPTTPFVLLAAGCFSRASERCHRWLLAAPMIGPALADWQAGRGLAPSVRVKAIVLVWLGIGGTVVFFAQALALRLALLAIATAVTVFLWRLP